MVEIHHQKAGVATQALLVLAPFEGGLADDGRQLGTLHPAHLSLDVSRLLFVASRRSLVERGEQGPILVGGSVEQVAPDEVHDLFPRLRFGNLVGERVQIRNLIHILTIY